MRTPSEALSKLHPIEAFQRAKLPAALSLWMFLASWEISERKVVTSIANNAEHFLGF